MPRCRYLSGQSGSAVTGTYAGSTVGPGVEVRLYNASVSFDTRTTVSGGTASFRFENIPPGTYTLEIAGGGYKQELIVTAGRDVAIAIDPGINQALTSGPLATVTVIATGERQLDTFVAKTVDVIDGREMRDRADFSLIESLRTIPGFRVQQSGGFGRVATIKTRGLRNQDTALLLDGIRFRDVAAINGDATSFLSDFTLTSVSQVEVLRGPGSSIYGTNSIGGTIDFRTPEARPGTHGQIGGALGGLGLGRFRGNLSHGTRDDRFGIGGGVSRTVYSKGVDGDDDAHNTNLQTRVDVNPFSFTSISGRIFFSDADVRLNSSPDSAGTPPASNRTIIDAVPFVTFTPDVNDPDNRQSSRAFSGQIVVDQAVNDRFAVGGYYQGMTTDRTNENGVLGIGFQSASTSIFDGRTDTGNARISWTPRPENTLRAGYEFERERFVNEGQTQSGTGNFFTRAGQRSNTFYAQDLARLAGGRLQLAGGVRVQAFKLTRPEFSIANAPYSNLALEDPPNAYTFDGAASYFFSRSGTKLRAHVGNGYRVPSLYERFGAFFSTFGTPSFVALGDPNLRPEKSIAFDAGIEQNLADQRVRLSATYFYTKLTDIIGFSNVVPKIVTTTRPFGGYDNQKGGLARGLEFSMKARPASSTDLFASYTYTNSDQATPQVSGSGITRTLGVPDHQFTLVATQRFKRAWVTFDLLATSVYLAPIFDTNAFTFRTYIYRFDGNRRGDLTGGYTFGFKKERMTLRVYGTIENIFDQEYYENGFRTVGANGRFGLTLAF
ncbi:MAG: TonB-dependent receptor [Pyrinomonadaceae bacterium]